MTDLAPFPLQEVAVIELLSDLGTCDVVSPADLAGNLPFIRIVRNGGNDDRISDAGHVDIDVFAVSRTAAQAVAEQVRQRMISFPHSLSMAVIDRVETALAPSTVPWGNPSIALVTASYAVTARRNPPS